MVALRLYKINVAQGRELVVQVCVHPWHMPSASCGLVSASLLWSREGNIPQPLIRMSHTQSQRLCAHWILTAVDETGADVTPMLPIRKQVVRFVDNFPKVAQLREQGRNLNSQSTCPLLQYHDALLFGSPHINPGQWGQPFHVPQAIFFFLLKCCKTG